AAEVSETAPVLVVDIDGADEGSETVLDDVHHAHDEKAEAETLQLLQEAEVAEAEAAVEQANEEAAEEKHVEEAAVEQEAVVEQANEQPAVEAAVDQANEQAAVETHMEAAVDQANDKTKPAAKKQPAEKKRRKASSKEVVVKEVAKKKRRGDPESKLLDASVPKPHDMAWEHMTEETAVGRIAAIKAHKDFEQFWEHAGSGHKVPFGHDTTIYDDLALWEIYLKGGFDDPGSSKDKAPPRTAKAGPNIEKVGTMDRFAMLKSWLLNDGLSDIVIEEKFQRWAEDRRQDKWATVSILQLERIYGTTPEAEEFIAELVKGQTGTPHPQAPNCKKATMYKVLKEVLETNETGKRGSESVLGRAKCSWEAQGSSGIK
ncbi:unnamed protein product, partial [Effrenium voratum]